MQPAATLLSAHDTDRPGRDEPRKSSGKGVRRTVAVLAAVALLVYLLTFAQILLMK